MSGSTDAWDDVPIEAYEAEAGEASAPPRPKGASSPDGGWHPRMDGVPPEAPAEEERPAPKAKVFGDPGFREYLRLREEGFNADYAAEQAVRHRKEVLGE